MRYVLAALLLAVPPAARGAEPVVARLVAPAAGTPVVEVTGLAPDALAAVAGAKPTAAELAQACRLVVDRGTPAETAARPPVAGTWAVTATALRFEPQFALAPGVTYRATGDLSAVPRAGVKSAAFTATLTVPKPPPGPPTAVAAVYPSGGVLPENTLRFYVYFSGPMTRGDIYRHVKLLRADGREVASPFLELDEELWSTDGLRVTLLFHPGRVKRELVPREELGPILEAGRRYTLVIDRGWADADGRPLVAEVRKSFAAGPAADAPVAPADWALVPPRAGSAAPLVVRLAKPLDHALLGSMLWVADAAGKRVDGEVTVGGGERVVTFAPAKPWAKGEYKLMVDTRLEDVCGNRVGEPFEVDVFRPVQRRIEAKAVARPFAAR